MVLMRVPLMVLILIRVPLQVPPFWQHQFETHYHLSGSTAGVTRTAPAKCPELGWPDIVMSDPSDPTASTFKRMSQDLYSGFGAWNCVLYRGFARSVNVLVPNNLHCSP